MPVHPELVFHQEYEQDELTDFAWAAGFLDGEGYFQGMRGSGRCANGFRLAITASQVGRRAPIDRLQEILGGHAYVIGQATSGRGARAETYKWALQNAVGIREALPLIIPYLVVKRKEAELLYRLAHLVQANTMMPAHLRGRGRKWYTPEQRAEMNEIVEDIKLARRDFACSP